jgi:hypothetical protein
MPKKTVTITMDEVMLMMVLVKKHVKPEEYKPGSDVRQLVEACHAKKDKIQVVPGRGRWFF